MFNLTVILALVWFIFVYYNYMQIFCAVRWTFIFFFQMPNRCRWSRTEIRQAKKVQVNVKKIFYHLHWLDKSLINLNLTFFKFPFLQIVGLNNIIKFHFEYEINASYLNLINILNTVIYFINLKKIMHIITLK